MQMNPSIYTDFQGLADLKHQARQDQAGSLDRVASQFESLFVQMMVKQMRQASFGDGLFDSERTKFYQEMYDQQLSVHMAESGGLGIGKMLKQQLGAPAQAQGEAGFGLDLYRNRTAVAAVPLQQLKSLAPSPVELQQTPATPEVALDIDSPETFVQGLWQPAADAAASLGLEPQALLAQAALESGWGGHVMQAGDGSSSHNLFGIKADQRWDGDRVRVETLEYVDGVAVKRRESFRAYDSFDESFQDYVAFLRESPRYADALASADDSQAYFGALQQAGYATDPAYAEKIMRVMQGSEMKQAVAGLKESSPRPI